MPKASSSQRQRSGARGKTGKGTNPSIAKPLAVLAAVVLVALGAAYYLQRSADEQAASAPAPSSQNAGSPISPQGWSKGNSLAKAVLVEFVDFQCGACAAASSRMAKIARKYGSELKIVFKHHPMQRAHGNAMIAARAAEAAGLQFKFWEMHDLLLQRQHEWAKVPDAQSLFLRYAAELQLNLARFRRDLWTKEVGDKIYRDIMEGQMAQVRSVPAFFLNGKAIPNSRDEFEFEQRIVDGIRSLQ
ncbi:MAG: thioredoxin domain-containing protein [Acidobacteria bacterium]|nr:thioredoxin domain-containing protein [Acidobacteriota bacterium]